MKNLKLWSGIIMIITAFLFGGCYTQVAMNNGYGDNNSEYGDGNDQGYQNDQTPADSVYGDQYGYADSLGSNQNNYFNDYYNQPPWANDYFYGYSPLNRNPFWRYNSNFSLGFGWGNDFYNPYSWDPYGLWTNYYPGYWGPYPYYPTYYDPYYSPYWGGNWYYNNGRHYKTRTGEMTRLRNDNGFNRGDRNGYRQPSSTTVYSTSTVRYEPDNTSRSSNRSTTSSVNNSNDRNQNRSSRSSYRSPRNNNGRSEGTNNVRKSSGRQENHPTYTRPANRSRSNNSSQPRSEPRRYEAPKSYSPPARTYSAPRSYNPPPARSSGESRGGSDRNRGR